MKNKSRRKYLKFFLGVLGSTLLLSWIFRRQLIRKFLFTFPENPSSIKITSAPLPSKPCVLTSQQVEGPFYFPSPERRNIVEDRKGAPLKLNIQVTNYPDCVPLNNAVVEIWQADAEGNYSGYPKQISKDEWKMFMLFGQHGHKKADGEYTVSPVSSSKYLRGIQRTDVNGWVSFETIVPCWYLARVPHIHFKVFVNDKEQINSQFYFDKAFCDHLFTTEEPYNKVGICPIDFKSDGVLSGVKGDQSGLLLSIIKDENKNYATTCTIGIQQA